MAPYIEIHLHTHDYKTECQFELIAIEQSAITEGY